MSGEEQMQWDSLFERLGELEQQNGELLERLTALERIFAPGAFQPIGDAMSPPLQEPVICDAAPPHVPLPPLPPGVMYYEVEISA